MPGGPRRATLFPDPEHADPVGPRAFSLLTSLHDTPRPVRRYTHAAPSEAARDMGITKMMGAAITPSPAHLQ